MTTVRRGPLAKDDFEIIRRAFLRDASLSFKARGVGAWLMTHTEQFEFTVERIAQLNRCGVSLVSSALKELEKAGYLRRERVRDDVTGQLGDVVFHISDIPGQAQDAISQARETQAWEIEGHKKSTPKEYHSQGEQQEEKILPDESGETLALIGLPEVTTAKQPDVEAEFADWYALYPRKVGKQAALRAYRAARKKAAPDALLAGLRRYAAERQGADQTYTKHPATWLNGGCWEDEQQAKRGAPTDQYHRVTAADDDGWGVYEGAEEIDPTERV